MHIHNIDTYTDPQLKFWLSLLENKRVTFVGGIGAGKTYAGCVQLLNTKPNTTTMILSPTFSQLKDSSFKLFEELYGSSGLIQSHNKTDMTTLISGNRTLLWRSADRPDRLRGANLNYAWIDEASYCDEETVNVLLGRLRRSPGTCWMTMTPRGRAHFTFRMIQSGLFKMIHAPTNTNKFLPQEYLQGLQIAYDGSHAQQELEGLFVDVEGALFRESWFKPWEGPPPERLILCRAWDTAATKDGGDWTVGMLMGLVPGTSKVIILDVVRERFGADVVDPMIRNCAEQDGQSVTIVLEQEPGSAGKRLIQHQIQQLAGWRVAWSAPGTNKIVRAQPLARAAAGGEIYYTPNKPWIRTMLDEFGNFTGTTADSHDDQVDAASLGYNHLTGRLRRVVVA